MLVVGAVILVLAHLHPPAILEISYFAATLFASSWGPVAFMSVWSTRITASGAFWGIVIGFGTNFLAKLLELYEIVELPVLFHPVVIGITFSVITIIVVSNRGTVSDAERQYRISMHQTLRFAQGLIACGVILMAALIVFYVIPYESAIEQAKALSIAPEVKQ